MPFGGGRTHRIGRLCQLASGGAGECHHGRIGGIDDFGSLGAPHHSRSTAVGNICLGDSDNHRTGHVVICCICLALRGGCGALPFSGRSTDGVGRLREFAGGGAGECHHGRIGGIDDCCGLRASRHCGRIAVYDGSLCQCHHGCPRSICNRRISLALNGRTGAL